MRKRFSNALTILAAGFLPVSASARPVAVDAAPVAWVAYAEAATGAITGWINSEDAPAPAVRAAIERATPAAEPAQPFVLKVWVDKRGAIARIGHAPLGTEPDGQFGTLLVGKPLGKPPRGMRQPMRLALDLAPPDTAPSP